MAFRCILFASAVLFVESFLLPSWLTASSANVTSNWSEVSQSSYIPDDSVWVTAAVPGTVFGGLVENGQYRDIMFGQNLFQINASVFDVPWLYRTTFVSTRVTGNGRTLLRFLGLNYRAQIWVNGIEVAQSAIGAFRHFSFDISELVTPGLPSAIAVIVARQHDSWDAGSHDVDLGITFVDWAPNPPDSSLGLWEAVEIIETPGCVTVRYPFVSTVLVRPTYATPSVSSPADASLNVTAELTNWANVTSVGTVHGEIRSPAAGSPIVASFSQAYSLLPYETATLTFSAAIFPQLLLVNPALWWPWQMGSPTFHRLALNVTAPDGQLSDAISARFGIREVSAWLDESGNRAFAVNGVPLLIRGAGWAPDLFLRSTGDGAARRLATAIAYTKQMGLNTLRLEGKMEVSVAVTESPRESSVVWAEGCFSHLQTDAFYDLADESGLLVMPGWCCCDAWQHWPYWTPVQYSVSCERGPSRDTRNTWNTCTPSPVGVPSCSGVSSNAGAPFANPPVRLYLFHLERRAPPIGRRDGVPGAAAPRAVSLTGVPRLLSARRLFHPL